MNGNMYLRKMERLVNEGKAHRVEENLHVRYELTEKGWANQSDGFFRLQEGETIESVLEEIRSHRSSVDPELVEKFRALYAPEEPSVPAPKAISPAPARPEVVQPVAHPAKSIAAPASTKKPKKDPEPVPTC
jgi:hypothetical protein